MKNKILRLLYSKRNSLIFFPSHFRIRIGIIYLGISCCLLVGCTEDTKINFLLNGHDIEASNTEPAIDDSLMILAINAGDTIILTDVSSPQKSIKTRVWDIDGDGEWDSKFTDKDDFATTFNNEGLQKITFCANDENNCVTKWIYVQGFGPEIPLAPVIAFIKPEDYASSSTDKKLEIEVATENVFSKEELEIKVGSNSPKFNFNEDTGILTATIKLSRGNNIIEVLANTVDGTGSDQREVMHGTIKSSDPPRPLNPSVEILDKNLIVSKKSATIKVRTRRYDGSTLNVSLNGQAYNDYRASAIKGTWVINLFNLREGKNDLSISISNEHGEDQDRTRVTYENNPVIPVPVERPLPVITINYDGKAVSSAAIEVKIDTDKFKGKELDITLDGVRQSNYKNMGRGKWTIPLNLEEGDNRLIVKATNANGTTTSEKTIKYVKEEAIAGPREKPFANSCNVGIPVSQYSGFSKNCLALYNKDKYEVKLLPNQKVELQSFYVYTNTCGGLEITLDGDGDTQIFKTSLNAGKTQILLSEVIDAMLAPQKSYTLLLRPLSNYGGCKNDIPPRLEKVTDCQMSQNSCNALTLNQSNNPILYDLKIKY